jgi:hypothetical protein
MTKKKVQAIGKVQAACLRLLNKNMISEVFVEKGLWERCRCFERDAVKSAYYDNLVRVFTFGLLLHEEGSKRREPIPMTYNPLSVCF